MNQLRMYSKRLRRLTLATLAALALLSGSATFAQGGTGAGKITGSGTVTNTWIGRNLLGWKVGTVTVTQTFQCVDCNCAFSGAIVITETLPVQSCVIVSEQTSPITCPGSASANCPSGSSGQSKLVVYECCLFYAEFAFCFSKAATVEACP